MRVASPSVLPRPNATASQRGGRSSSPATPHAKRRWRRERRATFPPRGSWRGGRKGLTPRWPSPRSASLPQPPARWCWTGRAPRGPSVPRPLPRLPVVVGEGGWAPDCQCGGGELGMAVAPAPPATLAIGSPTPSPTTTGSRGRGRGTNGPRCAWPVRRHPAGVRSSDAERGDGRRGGGPSFPFTSRPGGKGGSSLPPPPTLCVWGGGRR